MTKIKVKLLNHNCTVEISQKGDWIDLRSAVDLEVYPPQAQSRKKVSNQGEVNYFRDVTEEVLLIPLGVVIQLPKGFEAIIAPRSSTDTKFGIGCANSIGIIDNIYCGENDQWHFKARAVRRGSIKEGDRICQFRIQLSQKATRWQKIKWLFSNKINIKYVSNLNNKDRGGFGSTGIN